eukprot:1180080-Prorocentrum_minimum.AAC.7
MVKDGRQQNGTPTNHLFWSPATLNLVRSNGFGASLGTLRPFAPSPGGEGERAAEGATARGKRDFVTQSNGALNKSNVDGTATSAIKGVHVFHAPWPSDAIPRRAVGMRALLLMIMIVDD